MKKHVNGKAITVCSPVHENMNVNENILLLIIWTIAEILSVIF